MNSATLRTLRNALGLSIRDAANMHGVTDRTWRHWESAANPNPVYPNVAAQMEQHMLDVTTISDDMLELLPDDPDDAPADTIYQFTRYRTYELLLRNHPEFEGHEWLHDLAVARAYTDALASGYNVQVVWDDDPTAMIGQDWNRH